MFLNCLGLAFVSVLRLFVVVIIPLHSKMCCCALNALMELRGDSGAEGGSVQMQLVRKET